MNPMISTPHLMPHLTDDQMDDALIGDLAVDCAAHLAGCDECQLRLEQAEAPIANFNAVSLAWSERRSATLPLRPTHSAHTAWLPRALWAATAAAVLAVGITVPVVRHSREGKSLASSHDGAAPTLMASTGPVDNPVAARDEQIARDNQMLQNIDRELDATPSTIREYGLQPASIQTHAPAASVSVRN